MIGEDSLIDDNIFLFNLLSYPMGFFTLTGISVVGIISGIYSLAG
jgi:hypothetical protein